MSDSWAQRLYQTVKAYIPWPHWEPFTPTPALQLPPMDDDDNIQFWTDIRYLQDLADAIRDDCRIAHHEISLDLYAGFIAQPLLAAINIPVESQQFWDQWDWPDHAADLLENWRAENQLRHMIDAIETETNNAAA